MKALRSPQYAKLVPSVPKVDSDEAATALLHSLIPHTFFLRIARGPSISSGVKAVQIVPQQLFQPDDYYVWLVDPNPVRQLVLAVGMVAVVLAGVMFPLWPVKMRIGVWYLSVGVLGLIAAFFGLAIVRLVLWLVTKVVARPGIWIFPNLFADVGFVRSAARTRSRLFVPFADAAAARTRRSTRSSRSGAGTCPRQKNTARRKRPRRPPLPRPRRARRSAAQRTPASMSAHSSTRRPRDPRRKRAARGSRRSSKTKKTSSVGWTL